MATISFKEDLSVTDKKKVNEIAQALKQPKDVSIRPTQPPKLPENARELWFRR